MPKRAVCLLQDRKTSTRKKGNHTPFKPLYGARLDQPTMLKYYRETRVSTKPTTHANVVDIPTSSRANVQFRVGQANLTQSEGDSFDDAMHDEDLFARRFAATQGNVYLRQRRIYPRAFAWRVVGDNKVLEIRSVDVTKSSQELNEASLVLRFHFAQPIIPDGVALADREDHEVMNVFVLTTERQLYTLNLWPDFFRRAQTIDDKATEFCRRYAPSPLTISYPHRLYARNPYEVFISLDNGTLLRMRRRAGDDGSNWSIVTFDEKPWGSSFRGLLSWGNNNTIKYDGRALDPNASCAIAVSPDEAFVFVVGLNHTLKVWNLASQRLVGSTDLLGAEARSEDDSSATLNPADSAFIRIFVAERASDNARYYVVTYSPHDGGQFKFWAIRGGVMTNLVIEDLFPGKKLKPADPDPSGSVFWNVVDFYVKPTKDAHNMSLWVLWKNNNLHQLYSLHFDLDNLDEVWDENWTAVVSDVRSEKEPSASIDWDVQDPTERWLEFLLYPGRYSTEALVTALAIYRNANDSTGASSAKVDSSSLEQEMTAAVSQSVILREANDGSGDEMDHFKYRKDIDARWRQLWQIAEDVSKRQTEVLSLSYDTFNDTPWLSFADGCAIVRELSSVGLVYNNETTVFTSPSAALDIVSDHRSLNTELGRSPGDLAAILKLSSSIYRQFSPELLRASRNALATEICGETSVSASDRIARFYDTSRYAELIPDELVESIGADIEKAIALDARTAETFITVAQVLPHRITTAVGELVSTEFGRSVIVRGASEEIALIREILHGLILLTVFIETELKQDDSLFDGKYVFTSLVEFMKGFEILHWLGIHTRTVSASRKTDSLAATSTPAKPTAEQSALPQRQVTILEDLFASKTKPRPAVDVPQTYTLSQQIHDVLAPIAKIGASDMQAVFIECNLLSHGDVDLATEFLCYLPNTAWSTYVKGRLYLARGDFDVAFVYFQKASYLLSYGKVAGDLNELSSSLVDLVSANLFYSGLTKYYQHVLGLFEASRAFAHVADVAHLALQALQSDKDTPHESPEFVSTRTDLLARLFHASLRTCRFDEAWAALCRYTDPALQRNALTSLVTTILTASGPGTAGIKRILRLPLSLKPSLVQHVDEVLVSLAGKQAMHGRLSQALPGASWQSQADVPEYERVLEAYRIARHDLRGAAEIAYGRVRRLQEARKSAAGRGQVVAVAEDDVEEKELRQELLFLINLLSCMGEGEAYIFDQRGGPAGGGSTGKAGTAGSGEAGVASLRPASATSQDLTGPESQPAKRVVITLEDVRREYQAALDRVNRVESGDWDFGLDRMDVRPDAGHGQTMNGRQSRMQDYVDTSDMMDLS